MMIENFDQQWSTTTGNYDFKDKNVMTLFSVNIFVKFNGLKSNSTFLKL